MHLLQSKVKFCALNTLIYSTCMLLTYASIKLKIRVYPIQAIAICIDTDIHVLILMYVHTYNIKYIWWDDMLSLDLDHCI